MTAASGAYVYLLRDPDVADPIKSIIYVGKGTGFRGGQHTRDARRELERLKNEADDDATEADLGRKIAMLNDLGTRGQEARIDVLAYADGQTLTDRLAFGIEAALIEVLAMTELGNQVKGHAVRMMPESVFTKANRSKPVTLPAEATAISVSVKGLWGGRDYTGTLIASTEDQVWENARQLWVPMAAREAATVTSLAATDDPVVLIALAKHPDPEKKNLVVGVFELSEARETSRLKGGGEDRLGKPIKEYFGWEFLRTSTDAEKPATTLLRTTLMGNTLVTADGQPVRRTENPYYVQGLGRRR